MPARSAAVVEVAAAAPVVVVAAAAPVKVAGAAHGQLRGRDRTAAVLSPGAPCRAELSWPRRAAGTIAAGTTAVVITADDTRTTGTDDRTITRVRTTATACRTTGIRASASGSTRDSVIRTTASAPAT